MNEADRPNWTMEAPRPYISYEADAAPSRTDNLELAADWTYGDPLSPTSLRWPQPPSSTEQLHQQLHLLTAEMAAMTFERAETISHLVHLHYRLDRVYEATTSRFLHAAQHLIANSSTNIQELGTAGLFPRLTSALADVQDDSNHVVGFSWITGLPIRTNDLRNTIPVDCPPSPLQATTMPESVSYQATLPRRTRQPPNRYTTGANVTPTPSSTLGINSVTLENLRSTERTSLAEPSFARYANSATPRRCLPSTIAPKRLSRAYVTRSTIGDYDGLFAQCLINPGEAFCTYQGTICASDDEARMRALSSDYIFHLVDASDPRSCYGRFINDSHDPDLYNCEAVRQPSGLYHIRATETIYANQECFMQYLGHWSSSPRPHSPDIHLAMDTLASTFLPPRDSILCAIADSDKAFTATTAPSPTP